MGRELGRRRDKLIKEARHDIYEERVKLPNNTRCTDCGAVVLEGRWTWETTAEEVKDAQCPACRRVEDGNPAGYVEIRGDFFKVHRKEIINLIKNIGKAEKEEHPLERIVAISDEEGKLVVTTTGVHIARRMGEALFRAYKGDYELQYAEDDTSVKVYWSR